MPDTPACDVGIVFALKVEAGGLIDRLTGVTTLRGEQHIEHLGKLDGRSMSLVISGVGQEAVALATEDLIAVRRPEWIISAGFAGGLDGRLARGNILMADCVADPAGTELSVGLKIDPAALTATPGVHVGRLLTVDRIIHEPGEKRSLGQKHSALACDMETLAVAQICSRHKVRFLSVRVITDTVDERLPAYLGHLLAQKTLAARLGAAAGALWRRPSSAKQMWQLKEDALTASDRLGKFLTGVVPQLTTPPPRQLPEA